VRIGLSGQAYGFERTIAVGAENRRHVIDIHDGFVIDLPCKWFGIGRTFFIISAL
jgi:hypothetical protein